MAPARSSSAPHREVLRARALLLAGDGVANDRIAAGLGVSATSVRSWRQRFTDDGLKRFGRVRPGRGAKPSIPPEVVEAIVEATLHTTPPGQTHWSCRTMAAEFGVSAATVQRIWHARGLKPHLVETFKLSNDPAFEEKLADVVGLYLDPPERAVVLCMDEKSQVQALDRTQQSLPMKKGRAGTMTHDYHRHGTTTLFAALDIATGQVTGLCQPRHRHQEFLRFLKQVAKSYPTEELHLVMDNYAAHKRVEIRTWLTENPRIHVHFTPTSASWMNLVEVWFGIIERQAIRRGTYTSVKDLNAKIRTCINGWNTRSVPFVWTKTAAEILTELDRKSTSTPAH